MTKTFCVLPWYSQEISPVQTTACCLLNNTQTLSQIKQDLLNNVAAPACQRCWDLEANGYTSRRQQENVFLDYKLDRDIERIYDDCAQGHAHTVIYQFATSNLCNQACVTCGSQFSSKWAEIERRMGITPAKTFELPVPDIDYASAKRITLLGGEPLFDPRTFEILQQLIDHGNTDCFVSLVTNGSIQLSQPQIDILSTLTDLNICVSIDGIDKRFEYMRWPADWNRLLDNIAQFKTLAKTVSVSYTVSAVNALYYHETVDWLQKNQLGYAINVVNGPAWLNPVTMPVELKQHLGNNSLLNSWKSVNGREITLEQFATKITAQDQAKRISIKYYMPELANIVFG